jgi:hypothetical protein
MDDNTAIILVAAIGAASSTIGAVLGYLSVLQSRKNTAIMTEVHHQTNGLLDARIESEKRFSAANAEVARHEGADDERARGDNKAAAVASTAMQAIAVAAAATPAQPAPTPEPPEGNQP